MSGGPKRAAYITGSALANLLTVDSVVETAGLANIVTIGLQVIYNQSKNSS